MRKLTRKDAAWLVALIPFLAILVEPGLFLPAALLALALISGLNLHSRTSPAPETEAAPRAIENALREESARRFPFGRMALYALGLVVILVPFTFFVWGLAYLVLFVFWSAMILSLLGLIFDTHKRDALIGLGVGIVFALIFMGRHHASG